MMMTDLLNKARDFESKYSCYADAERPHFHLTGPIGWINDPNGFSLYKNEYHLFFQYYPYDVKWGPMHWGHAKTSDFIKWEFLPAAMAPDTPADESGCFSGSAIALPDGKHLLMYTGVYEYTGEDGAKELLQRQCLAVGDGINYEKYEGNPVLTSDDLPEGASKKDFRDPHIFRLNDKYYSIVGSRPADGSGSLLVFESEDAFHWSYKCELEANHNEYGRMWECPDFFEVDGKHVIFVSPQEMVPDDLEFHAGYGTVALIGCFDPETFAFSREKVQAIDYGIDFYAPQVVATPDGRQVMIAWMENWTNADMKFQGRRLFGTMTLPRELHVREDGRLIQQPVRELEQYRCNRVAYENTLVDKERSLPGVSGRYFDMTVTVEPEAHYMYKWFKLRIAKDSMHETVLRFKPETNILKIDRSRSGGRFDIIHHRDIRTFSKNGSIKLRLIMDGNQLEVFVNDGEQTASLKLYNITLDAENITFEADKKVRVTVEKYDIIA